MKRLDNYKKSLKENNELYLRVKVHPGCSKSELKEILEDETVKIDIAGQAEKGRANKELIKFLAREFDILENNVKIISGSKNRLKLIKITVK